MMSKRRIRAILLPLGALIVIGLFWQYAVQWFDVPDYLVPTPLAVIGALRSGLIDGVLWPHIAATLMEIVIGYVVGCGIALVGAILVSEFPLVEETVYPLLAAIQSVPKVALAPILMVWFGFEAESKILLVALICFFPTFVNSFTGLRACDRNLVDLYRVFGAGRWKIVFGVKLPAAAGSIFAGLEISIVLALTGAVVAELLSSRKGLGYVIASSGANFNVAMMFACVVILAVIGVALTQLLKGARRRLAFWDSGARSVAAAVH